MRSLAIAFDFAFATLVANPFAAAADDADSFMKAPKAVQEAVKKEYPTSQVTDCDEKTEDGVTVYKINVKDGDKKYELTLGADGKVLKKKD